MVGTSRNDANLRALRQILEISIGVLYRLKVKYFLSLECVECIHITDSVFKDARYNMSTFTVRANANTFIIFIFSQRWRWLVDVIALIETPESDVHPSSTVRVKEWNPDVYNRRKK